MRVEQRQEIRQRPQDRAARRQGWTYEHAAAKRLAHPDATGQAYHIGLLRPFEQVELIGSDGNDSANARFFYRCAGQAEAMAALERDSRFRGNDVAGGRN